ncbi:hypothetical protein A8924_4337 [Saccharopolyspora erythraea NRRL 2338]|uniref:Uncharacterized protein n=2 Tax=Saccharopolyspora erythraea TaxID=1836 RepID=A4FGP5_SACEN|nr:hypothetical protein [Saccharopolyspora erythraea]PFG96924.1 hypothetical protein A8924_4337 [Saccharopolyspora erythraea NRRL 2338]QRK87150.1 hypothetical protein JQX30_20080 [Saccharopolyspora erythraea]CAM03220.1 hypothetical protein SACE_3949 [Saccharopolyspora erythraea NRRL 2338]
MVGQSTLGRDLYVAEATIRAGVQYAEANRRELVSDQIARFRRGWAGDPQPEIPDGFVPGFGPEDRYRVEFPRAYVIPVGGGQRSDASAARLVDHRVANDVRVGRARTGFRLAGRHYPAGSYVVDMHQPKRGLANVILADGADISADVPRLYDISGWSHRLLWGASVDVSRTDAPRVPTTPVAVAAPTGGVDAAPGQDLLIRLLDGKDVRAVNDLLGEGFALHRREDGTVVVPAAARQAAAERLGVRFTAAPGGQRGPVMRKPVIAAAVSPDELATLREMGFEVRPVSTDVLNAGFDLTRVDGLFVSAGLVYSELSAQARAPVDAFLARGGVVTRGAGGARFNAETGLLPARAIAGRDDANGVVAVTNAATAIGSGAPEPPSSTRRCGSPSWGPAWRPSSATRRAIRWWRATGCPRRTGTGRRRRRVRPRWSRECPSAARDPCSSEPNRCSGATPRACTRRSGGRCSGRWAERAAVCGECSPRVRRCSQGQPPPAEGYGPVMGAAFTSRAGFDSLGCPRARWDVTWRERPWTATRYRRRRSHPSRTG